MGVRHIGNMPVKFYSNWSNDIGGAVIQRFIFLFLALAAILFIDVEQFNFFGRELPRKHSCGLVEIGPGV